MENSLQSLTFLSNTTAIIAVFVLSCHMACAAVNPSNNITNCVSSV